MSPGFENHSFRQHWTRIFFLPETRKWCHCFRTQAPWKTAHPWGRWQTQQQVSPFRKRDVTELAWRFIKWTPGKSPGFSAVPPGPCPWAPAVTSQCPQRGGCGLGWGHTSHSSGVSALGAQRDTSRLWSPLGVTREPAPGGFPCLSLRESLWRHRQRATQITNREKDFRIVDMVLSGAQVHCERAVSRYHLLTVPSSREGSARSPF